MTIQPRSSVRRLATARAISFTGGAAAYVALTFTIYAAHGLGRLAVGDADRDVRREGLVGPFGGVLGDRFDRRAVMIVSDLAGAAAFAAMAFVHAPAFLVGLALLSPSSRRRSWSASQAAIPNLVGEDDLDLGEQPHRDRAKPRDHPRARARRRAARPRSARRGCSA